MSTREAMEQAITAPEMKTEEMLVIEIPVRELTTMAETQDWYQRNMGGWPMEKLDNIIRDKHHEEYLRNEHPGLQETWEQYQVMLALCSDKSYK